MRSIAQQEEDEKQSILKTVSRALDKAFGRSTMTLLPEDDVVVVTDERNITINIVVVAVGGGATAVGYGNAIEHHR